VKKPIEDAASFPILKQMQPKHRRNKYAMRAQNQTIMMGMNTLSYLNSGIEYGRCAVTVSRNGVL
jgi:hypothetical protein